MMSPSLDEKKQVIVELLDQLRPYQPSLGSYVISIYTNDFDYSVKLSNGKIRLAEELILDFEMNASIPAQHLRNAAAFFISDTPLAIEEIQTPVTERPSGMPWRMVLGLIILVIIGCVWYNAAQDQKARDIQDTARANIYSQVKIENGNYMVNRFFGGISDLKITVTNNSDYLVDIVKVKVTYIKADGDMYKEEMLYFNQLGAHSTQTLDAPNSNRGVKVKVDRESLVCSTLAIN